MDFQLIFNGKKKYSVFIDSTNGISLLLFNFFGVFFTEKKYHFNIFFCTQGHPNSVVKTYFLMNEVTGSVSRKPTRYFSEGSVKPLVEATCKRSSPRSTYVELIYKRMQNK